MNSMKPVVHFEIPMDDSERAKKFYASVFDWRLEDMPFQDDVYTFAITTPIDENNMNTETGAINGGMIKRDRDLKNPVITIGVPSIDEYVKKIEAEGGKVIVPKGEVPDMGYYAYFKDTEGNVMGLWESMKK
jgi:uncharacterized protein